MPLFVATVINEITVAGRWWRFEESIVLVGATDEDDARRAATAHAVAAETAYPNAEGEEVRWAFRELVDVAPAVEDDLSPERLAAGVEIASRSLVDLDAYHAAAGSADAARWTSGS